MKSMFGSALLKGLLAEWRHAGTANQEGLIISLSLFFCVLIFIYLWNRKR